jgi:hypothetical protein
LKRHLKTVHEGIKPTKQFDRNICDSKFAGKCQLNNETAEKSMFKEALNLFMKESSHL